MFSSRGHTDSPHKSAEHDTNPTDDPPPSIGPVERVLRVTGTGGQVSSSSSRGITATRGLTPAHPMSPRSRLLSPLEPPPRLASHPVPSSPRRARSKSSSTRSANCKLCGRLSSVWKAYAVARVPQARLPWGWTCERAAEARGRAE